MSAAAWRMFAPLAVTEVAVTFALAMTLGPFVDGEILLAAGFVVVGTLAFVSLHALVSRRFMARRLMPVLDYRFFRTGVDEPEPDTRLQASCALVRSYLHFAKWSAVASALTYAVGAILFASLTEHATAGVIVTVLGCLWAALFRIRLATIRFDSIISATRFEEQRLARVQYRSSRTHRLLALQGVLSTAARFHDLILLAVGGTAVLGLAIDASGTARSSGFLALAVAAACYLYFSTWIRQQILFSNPGVGDATAPPAGKRCVLFSQE